jgi:hypothetical protein
LAHGPEERAQMERKYPATEISMGRLKEILRKAGPLVGVGPRSSLV